ncbi:dihydrodipicolinate synthase family protein [Cyclobacterium jeungdonense]|uniref:Dihydrodipicolinate synthase family protein n=1 Tax=Cyclobacterium jeungdonense TaxID=708087 RepID=A0ABT8C2Q4_9BACT|nr:dihydrodipicolinate synthase family protein [Cyclobacterium jeungdonense]MDN3687054.1 dihydrodipicolinate synthase family protein [Cyclobacterium jeungdonense]
MNEKLKGVWPAMLTPLNEEGRPDIGQLEKWLEVLISQGMDGLYLLGSTGQGFLLSEGDRKRVTEVSAAVNSGRVPIIVQVGSMTTNESVRLAKHAESCKVDGISSVAPVYYGSSDGSSAMALKHYEEIAKSTDLPFFPYQLGSTGFSDGLVGFVNKLLQLPNMAGMKLTTNNLLEISTISYSSRGKLTLFSGADELMCHAALCGTSGAIGSFYNLFGPECRFVRNSFLNGNVGLATDFMLVFQEMIAEVLPNIWTFFRQAIQFRYTVDIGPAIPPVGNTNKPWEKEKIEALVELIIDASRIKESQHSK